MSNAYGSLKRQSILDTIAAHALPHSQYLRWWLCGEHLGMAPHTSGASVPMSSTTGVPQGNPVSTVLFCLVLHDAIQRTRTAVPHYFK
eukprot:349233-Amphidinium_carterae.1